MLTLVGPLRWIYNICTICFLYHINDSHDSGFLTIWYFSIAEMYTGFRKRGVRIRSRSNQHLWPIRSYRILCAVGQSSDQEDVWRVHRIISLALLHDRFQQLRESNLVAVRNHVRKRTVPQPSQPDPALRYVTFCNRPCLTWLSLSIGLSIRLIYPN